MSAHISSERRFRDIFREVLSSGSECSPRGMKCMELEDAQFIVPTNPLMTFEGRKLSLDYLRREFQWYLKGNKHDLSIIKHAKIWENHVNQDQSLNSNYGHYLFFKGGLDRAAQELLNDVDSRRSFLSISNSHEHLGSNDVPCTYGISWRIRDGQLNQSVMMRSNDLVLGAGSDWPIFSWIHQMMLVMLRQKYPGLALGRYVHKVDSLHIYERHYDLAERIASGAAAYNEVLFPVPDSMNDLGGMFSPLRAGLSESSFAKWLYEVQL